MPFKSQAQRGLMYAAAEHKGGAGGVSQSAAKKMVADDVPGKLPEHINADPKRKALNYKSMK